MKPTTKKNVEIAGAVGIGLAALAAGAIFLYGKDGAQRKKQIKGWMLKAKGEVLEKLETLEEFNEESYNKIIDEVATHYKQAKNIDPEEIAGMIAELKGHFQSIHKQLTKKPAAKRKPAAKKAK